MIKYTYKLKWKSCNFARNNWEQSLSARLTKDSSNNFKMVLKTRYCPLCIARCDLLAAIFVMLKILKLLFVVRIELFNNNGRLAPVKTKTTTEARKA